jgi:hypothetical protein
MSIGFWLMSAVVAILYLWMIAEIRQEIRGL